MLNAISFLVNYFANPAEQNQLYAVAYIIGLGLIAIVTLTALWHLASIADSLATIAKHFKKED